jgi:hypothetical protein
LLNCCPRIPSLDFVWTGKWTPSKYDGDAGEPQRRRKMPECTVRDPQRVRKLEY